MIAFLQFTIAFVLALVAGAETLTSPDPGGALVFVAVFAGGAAIAGRFLQDLVAHAEEQGEERARTAWVALSANLGRIGALAGSWTLLTTYGMVRLPEELGIGGWFLAPTLVALLPFALLSLVVRTCLHGAAAAAEAAPKSLVRSLLLDARMSLLPAAPLLAFALYIELDSHATRDTAWGRLWRDVGGLPTVRTALLLAAVAVALLVVPGLLRRAWGCRPLPAGPLRERLEAYARRVGFRAHDYLVWPTGGEHMNAAVVGILPRFRYVFFTDALLETLSPDEIEAVFAHEAGHARRGHLPLFLGYTAVLAFAAFLPASVLGPLEQAFDAVPPAIRVVLVILLWLGFVFGWVSRRLEQEADVFGIETLQVGPAADGTPAAPLDHPFARALERVAISAGGIREITGWRHFSIADRVEFVRQYLTDERVRRAYRMQIRLLRGTLFVALAVTVGFAAMRFPAELRGTPVRALLEELDGALVTEEPSLRAARLARAAEAAHRAGRSEDALRWWTEAARLGAPPDALRAWAEALEGAGSPLGAAAAWEMLAARKDAPESLREAARGRAKALAAPPPRR